MKIVLVCCEASGDLLGAGLAQELRRRCPQIELAGVTGERMRAAGVRSWLDCKVFSVMGYWEALRRLPALWHARRRVLRELRAQPPAVFVGIDAPDLNLGLGAAARGLGCKYVQYVCPSFWAWRPKRAGQLAATCDRVLALLPFELEHCGAAGIAARFVGHRLADELRGGAEARAQARRSLKLAPDARVLAVLPGSRPQEIASHQRLFLRAAGLCRQRMADLQVLYAPAHSALAPAAAAPSGVVHCPGQARAALLAADAAIVKSGTATLEAALLDCPQVIAYRAGPVTGWLVKSRLGELAGRDFGLPNLAAGARIVPELIEDQLTAAKLAAQALELFKPAYAAQMRRSYQGVRAKLACGADERAAQAVLELAPA